MTLVDFAKVIAYIAAATQKPIPPETVEVYYDLLGDLEIGTLQAAAKRVVLEHKWATFPSVAELREAAMEVQAGSTVSITPQEAFAMAWRTAGCIDPDIHGEWVVFDDRGRRLSYSSQAEWVMSRLPEAVVAAMHTFGVGRLIANNEPIGVLQAQFCQTYAGLLTVAKRDALLPAKLRAQIADIGRENRKLESKAEAR